MSASELSVAERLSEALGQLAMRGGYGLGVLASERLAVDLLSVVQALVAEGAAAELRAAAEAITKNGRPDLTTVDQVNAVNEVAQWLDDRADALEHDQ